MKLSAQEFDEVRCLAAEIAADRDTALVRAAELWALRRLRATAGRLRTRPLPLARALNCLPAQDNTDAWRAAICDGRDAYDLAQPGMPDLLRRVGAI